MSGSLKMAKLDFFTMKSQLVTYFSLVAIIAIFEFMSSSLMMLCLTAAWFIALFSTNIFVVQEKNNLDLLYGSLSLRLKEIVAGRYFSILLNYLLAFSMVIVVHAAAALLTGKPFDFAGAPAAFGVSLLVFSAIVGVQVPLFFKMGYIKAKGWAMLPFLAVMALVASPFFLPALSDIIQQIMSNPNAVFIVGILASFAVLSASLRLSVLAYRNRI